MRGIHAQTEATQYSEELASFASICDNCENLQEEIAVGEQALEMALLRLTAQCHRWVALLITEKTPKRTALLLANECSNWIRESYSGIEPRKERYKELWIKKTLPDGLKPQEESELQHVLEHDVSGCDHLENLIYECAILRWQQDDTYTDPYTYPYPEIYILYIYGSIDIDALPPMTGHL